MVRYSLLITLTAAALLLASGTRADTLLMDGVQQSQADATARPKRGMSMERVQSAWGTPVDRRNAIGDPPISRWEYPGFVVYFEYSHVIHSVTKR